MALIGRVRRNPTDQMNLLAAALKPSNFEPGRRKGRGNVDLLQAENVTVKCGGPFQVPHGQAAMMDAVGRHFYGGFLG
jgi:hypothetical protein